MESEAGDCLAQGDYAEGLRWMVVNGPFGSFNAYVGIPVASDSAGLSYHDLDTDELCPQPHGGWTFSSSGDGTYRPEGWWWYGWDYAHGGDYVPGLSYAGSEFEGYRWTLDEVVQEVAELLPLFDHWLGVRMQGSSGARSLAAKADGLHPD